MWSLVKKYKDVLIRWTYLFIVVIAALTMIFILSENRQIVRDIQDDRKEVMYDLCLDTNAKNDELKSFAKDVALERAQKAAREANKPEPTKAPPLDPVLKKFIDVLATQQNCYQLIINRFGSPPPSTNP